MSPRHFVRAAAIDLSVAARNAVRHGRRSLSGAAAVTFGTVAMILAAGFIQWIFWAMREGTIYAGLGHIQIVRVGYLEHGTAEPFNYLLPDNSPAMKLIERTRHVLGVAPRLDFTGLISHGSVTLSFLGRGLDPDREVGAKNAIVMEAGQGLSNSDPDGVLLGQGLAANLGAKVGDTVVLLVNRRSGALNGVEAKVRGIFSTVTKAYDDMAVHVRFALADNMLGANGAGKWVVFLDETSRTRDIARSLAARLDSGLRVIPWYESADFYNKTVTLFSRQVLVMKVIIALVVILSISNTMMTNVMERTNEIATAMAIGLSRRRVLSRFLAEGVLVGLFGGVMGLGLGYFLAMVISKIGIPMPPPPGMARGYIGQILVTGGLAWNAVFVAGITALVASLYPAWRASRMVIADALRHGR